MYKYWLKYREDLVSLAKITGTIIAIASFLGFSLPEKFGSSVIVMQIINLK